MKKTIFIFGGLLISLHLFIAVGNTFSKEIVLNTDFSKTENTKKASNFSIEDSNNLLNAVEFSNSISFSNNNQPSSFRIFFNNYAAFSKRAEQLFLNTFSQYISLSTNFFIQYQNIDIIFPFHYFW